MTTSYNPRQNRLLTGLSPVAYARLLPNLELVYISAGDGIYEPEVRITYLYFPIDCIIASMGELESGAAFQTSFTGNEGIVGISYLLGCERANTREVALTGGSAFWIKASLLKKEFDAGGKPQYLLLRFTEALIIQMTQIAVSARFHTIEQQLCYFLLMSLDRLPGNELRITHAQVAIFLGIRRESISVAAQKLETTTGAINYRRGHLTVVNRQELESRAGGNYAVVSKAYQHLQQSTAPTNFALYVA